MDECLDYGYISFDTDELRDEALDVVEGHIGESEETRDKCLEVFRTKLKELEDVSPCLEDCFLLAFLRVAKFDCAKAFVRLKKYYEKQEVLQKAFKNCQMTYSVLAQFPYLKASPYRMKDNSALIMSKFATIDPSKISFDERFYVELIVYSHLITKPVNQMCGVTIVIDFTGYNLRGFLSHPPTKLQLFMDTFQLILHPKDDSWRSLHESVPAEILSEEYGGHIKQLELIDLLKNVRQLDKEYRKQLKFGYVKTRSQRERFSMFKD